MGRGNRSVKQIHIDPREAFAGKIIVAKPARAEDPQEERGTFSGLKETVLGRPVENSRYAKGGGIPMTRYGYCSECNKITFNKDLQSTVVCLAGQNNGGPCLGEIKSATVVSIGYLSNKKSELRKANKDVEIYIPRGTYINKHTLKGASSQAGKRSGRGRAVRPIFVLEDGEPQLKFKSGSEFIFIRLRDLDYFRMAENK